jgi:hypothetical protein
MASSSYHECADRDGGTISLYFSDTVNDSRVSADNDSRVSTDNDSRVSTAVSTEREGEREREGWRGVVVGITRHVPADLGTVVVLVKMECGMILDRSRWQGGGFESGLRFVTSQYKQGANISRYLVHSWQRW